MCVLLKRKNIIPKGLGAVADTPPVAEKAGPPKVEWVQQLYAQPEHVFETEDQCNVRLEQLKAAKQNQVAGPGNRGARGGGRGDGGGGRGTGPQKGNRPGGKGRR